MLGSFELTRALLWSGLFHLVGEAQKTPQWNDWKCEEFKMLERNSLIHLGNTRDQLLDKNVLSIIFPVQFRWNHTQVCMAKASAAAFP